MLRSGRYGQLAASVCSVQKGASVWQVHRNDLTRDRDASWCFVQDGTDMRRYSDSKRIDCNFVVELLRLQNGILVGVLACGWYKGFTCARRDSGEWTGCSK